MVEVDQFRDLLIVPYKYLVDSSRGGTHAQGGPVWPDWEICIHRHHKAGKPIDWYPEYDETAPLHEMAEGWWAGACCDHFGHQVVDFSSKLALYSEILGPEEKIVVATKTGSGMDSYETLPGFARKIYEYFGFGADRIIVVSEPSRFRMIWSIPQQEQHGGWPATEEHLQALTRRADTAMRQKTPWQGGRFYVSRTRMAHGGGLGGEKFLENRIAAHGYQVIYPEELPLLDQLELYHSASELVFQEGSALHGLQLLGRVNAKLTILVRRPGFKMLETNLQQRFKNLTYATVGERFLFGRKANGKPADANGLLLPDEEGLSRLAESLGIDDPSFARFTPEFNADIEADIEAYLGRERISSRAKKHPAHIPQILGQLRQTRFAHLAPEDSEPR